MEKRSWAEEILRKRDYKEEKYEGRKDDKEGIS
jgi:hypothetical protein